MGQDPGPCLLAPHPGAEGGSTAATCASALCCPTDWALGLEWQHGAQGIPGPWACGLGGRSVSEGPQVLGTKGWKGHLGPQVWEKASPE